MFGSNGLHLQLTKYSFVEKRKYRCPRCRTETCSQACVEKHKQRASCSGKRDPAAYLKKGQLATPSGLDQDYNYLKNVERNIDHASQNVQERGIGVKTAASRNVARGWQTGSTLQRYISENQITIEHAPKGMSRQKDNHTRPTKSNRIVWTIELFDTSGERSIRHDCPESDSVVSLYNSYEAEKRNGDRKSRGSKRKRGDVEARKQPHPPSDSETIQSAAVETAKQQLVTEDQAALSMKSDSGAPKDNKPVAESPLAEVKNQPEEDKDSISANIAISQPDDQVEDLLQSEHQGSEHEQYPEKRTYFYLLKPATTSSRRVLIPLRSEATLTECLRNQVVQEYPTIVVLHFAPQRLPEGFMLVDDYLRSRLEEDAELRNMLSAAGDASEIPGTGEPDRQGQPEELDTQSILNMLKRDVRA